MITDNKSNKPIEAIIMIGDNQDTKIGITKSPNGFRRWLIKLIFGWKIEVVNR